MVTVIVDIRQLYLVVAAVIGHDLFDLFDG